MPSAGVGAPSTPAAGLVQRLDNQLDRTPAMPEAPDPDHGSARAGRAESLGPVEGVIVEHPGAVAVATHLEPLGCAVTRQLGCRCGDPCRRPGPVTVNGFDGEPGPPGDLADPLSQRCSADPVIQGIGLSRGERACPRPSPEDRAQLIAEGGQLADRNRVPRVNLDPVAAQEPRAPFPAREPVKAGPFAQVMCESAVDQVDAGELARVRGDGRHSEAGHGLMPLRVRTPLPGAAQARPMAAMVLIVEPW